MKGDETVLGRCPNCAETIPETWILVKYTKDDGTDSIWAECPGCGDVVAPE
ncbi:phage terminase large subunit family protein [Halorientalis persicus]|uniref:phage terminase large subunit family protein n=1 Tax=Halorientalis persicus TaxID=1367881 RepID=UPI001FCDBA6C|nr:phage terminase large subunit family protein [Halorientalis persicus]